MSDFSDDPLYEQALADLELEVLRAPYSKLEAYLENDLVDIAISGMVIAAYGPQSIDSYDNLERIYKSALDRYQQDHVAEKIAELRQEAADRLAEERAEDRARHEPSTL